MTSAALIVVQLLVLLGFAPFVVGLIRKVKARLQCRRGANLLQPYRDLAKLFRKEPVIPTATSWIFTATPYVLFASTSAAGLLVPVFVSDIPLSFIGNIIALVYFLALGTFFLILAGLDSGSAFGGMGSSREALVVALLVIVFAGVVQHLVPIALASAPVPGQQEPRPQRRRLDPWTAWALILPIVLLVTMSWGLPNPFSAVLVEASRLVAGG